MLHQTPSRFTEAGLVAEMKKLGIGRPSTYVSIIETIKKRGYVAISEKKLHPTELGTTTVRLLVELFPSIFDTSFTASMEELLDSVASGATGYEEAVANLQRPLDESLKAAVENLDSVRREMTRPTDEKCPQCGAQLLLKPGRFGSYLSCSDYPKCRFRKSAEKAVDSGRTCPECGAALVFKTGRYGRYLGCSSASCKHTEPAPTGVPCPEEGCGGSWSSADRRKAGSSTPAAGIPCAGTLPGAGRYPEGAPGAVSHTWRRLRVV